MLNTTCIYVARSSNHEQVRADLDYVISASKLWNVVRLYISQMSKASVPGSFESETLVMTAWHTSDETGRILPRTRRRLRRTISLSWP